MKNWISRIFWLLIIVIVITIGGFIIWGSTPLGPMDEAIDAVTSNDTVIVERTNWWVFRPTNKQPVTGFIIYPGGRVDPRSYAPAAQAIAAQGYLVVITPMPLNLAVFSPGKAAQVIAAYPTIRSWAVGGHSLGGAMAANFVYQNAELVKGLVLWAAYPASNNDLSLTSLEVVSIFGSLDGLTSGDEINASRNLLPAVTRWVALEGGNHAQFGWYGDQPGDIPATISRQKQQDQIIAATVILLHEIDQQR